MKKLIYTLAVSTILISSAPVLAAESGKVTLIHMGDVHGHMIPRPNIRSDGNGLEQGGLAIASRLTAMGRAQDLLLQANETG